MAGSAQGLDAALDDREAVRFAEAAAQFNSGHFFECHDTLEEIWQGKRGTVRDLLQGMIQVAVGFYHLGNGNNRGGVSQLEKGLAKLHLYAPQVLGFDLESFRRHTQVWLERARAGAPLRGTVADLPKIRSISPTSSAATPSS